MMRTWTKTLASLSLVLALFAAFCTTSLAERQDAATPAEEWTSSFAGQEPGELRVIEINGVSYRFRWAPPGTFKMGASEAEQEEEYRFRETDMIATSSAGPSEEDFKVLRESVVEETRQHEVTLTHGFWMLETEVTQPMWESIMGDNPSCFKGADLPVE
jgi:sulfatase modifying factor 1